MGCKSSIESCNVALVFVLKTDLFPPRKEGEDPPDRMTELARFAMQNSAAYTDGKVGMLLKRIEALEKTVAELSAALPVKRSPKDEALYNALREKRREAANELEIPLYCVATNKMLNGIVATKPKTLDELRTIYGFGPNKVKLYGKGILKVVADWS
jgi:superfamily II DNA helicase RecQ